MIFFSVILPVRNGGEYLKECVNSILNQTYTHFNLIVLDNYSSDGSMDWLRSLKNEKIVIYESNMSLSIEQNWARVTSVKKHEFMTLIGHDDILYPNFLETIHKLIVENPKAGLYTTHFDFIDGKGTLIRSAKTMPSKLSASELVKGFLRSEIDLMGTGYVMRSHTYDEIGGISAYPSLLFADFELWIRLIGDTYEAIDAKNCFAFRKHASTTTTSKDDVLLAACKKFIAFLAAKKNTDETIGRIIHEDLGKFLQVNAISMAHRLLRTPIASRNGLTVVSVADIFRQWAKNMGVETDYNPEKKKKYQLAKFIDSNGISRRLFLSFKKIYKTPIIKVN